MKKIMNKINFAVIGLMLSMIPAFAKDPLTVSHETCELIKELQGVFRTLQVLAFIGAAFYIAGWAWGWISGGEAKPDDIKKKGIALLVGFGLLFMIGVIISFVLSSAGMKTLGCPELTAW